MPSQNFELREVKSLSIIYASAETPISELGPTIGRLLGIVGAAASPQGVGMAGSPFCRYTDWQEASCTVDCGVPITAAFVATDAVHSGTLGGPGPHVCYTYFGPYDGLHASYEEAEAWMAANRYAWGGAPWDTYVTDPMAEPDSAKWQTDVCIPVRKTES